MTPLLLVPCQALKSCSNLYIQSCVTGSSVAQGGLPLPWWDCWLIEVITGVSPRLRSARMTLFCICWCLTSSPSSVRLEGNAVSWSSVLPFGTHTKGCLLPGLFHSDEALGHLWPLVRSLITPPCSSVLIQWHCCLHVTDSVWSPGQEKYHWLSVWSPRNMSISSRALSLPWDTS